MISPRHLALTFSVAAAAFPLVVAAQSALSALPAQATPAAAASLADSADDMVQAAKAAARADRNRESADLFAQAIVLAPERRRELAQ